MELGLLTFGTAMIAGSLSTLSPCVLPLLPILFGSAVASQRGAIFALAAGLALSFTIIGMFIATIGVSLGIDAQFMRTIAAVTLLLFGLTLLVPAIQNQFAASMGGISDVGNRWISRVNPEGVAGQFSLGLLLGLVWTPCVGPTLGAAITLASQGTQLIDVALVMLLFGIGAALPIAILGLVSRNTFARWRGKLLQAGKHGKQFLGVALILVALLIFSGLDKFIETWITSSAPQWWVEMTTRL